VILLVVCVWSATALAGDYVIGEGDTLGISVWGVKELSVAVKVRPDGKITIPALGEVKAAGLMPTELQALLSRELENFVRNPVVTVSVTEITNNKVFTFGGGVKPSVYALARRTTLLELLCQVEDTKNADLRRSYVLRNGERVKENFHELFHEGNVEEDMVIEPNDAIFFPALLETNVYVVGAVNKPKHIEHREGLTVMEAILEAEGFTKYADENDIFILRKDGGEEKRIRVKVKDLLRDGDFSQNQSLRPGDYVIVKEGIF
jgi:polysaccharide export outer membrane protein